MNEIVEALPAPRATCPPSCSYLELAAGSSVTAVTSTRSWPAFAVSMPEPSTPLMT